MASRRVEEAERKRVWAVAAANSAGLSIRKIGVATNLSSSRLHQLLHTDEAGEIPDWLSQLAKPELSSLSQREQQVILWDKMGLPPSYDPR